MRKTKVMELGAKPLTNLQLELLKAFSHDLSETELLELKELLVDFFAKRAIGEANRVWDQENWDEKKVIELLKTKSRTPYDH